MTGTNRRNTDIFAVLEALPKVKRNIPLDICSVQFDKVSRDYFAAADRRAAGIGEELELELKLAQEREEALVKQAERERLVALGARWASTIWRPETKRSTSRYKP